MEELLEKINPKKNVVVSGGMLSGKTTNVLFPLFDKIMDNNENVIVYDTKIEYLDEYYDKLIEKGYQVKIINLRDLNHSDKWNPLDLPYYFFKNGMEDKAEELLDNLGHVLYPDNKHTDPFWVNTSSSLFVGLSLGLFEDGNVDEINLNSVNEFITVGEEKASSTNNYFDEYFKMKDKISSSYINVSSTIVAPADTRASILSVAEKPLAKLVGNAQVSSLLSGSSFNFHDLTEKKMAIFVIGKPENKNINVISEMFLNQIMQYLIETRPTNKCHIMLDNIDDIENLLYINNYLKLNNYSNTRYYIGTCSVENFESKYMIKANMLSDIIRIKRDEVELDSFGVITKFNNYFKEVKINRSNVQYPIAKANDIKIFDLKGFVDTKRKERMDDLVNSVMPGLADKIKSNDSQTRADDLIKTIDAKIAELKTENKEKKQISNKKIDIKKLENVIGETVRKIEKEKSKIDDKKNNDEIKSLNYKMFLNNIKLHAKILDVPILEGFNINRDDGKFQTRIIDYANGQGISEQLISDGPLKANESFEDRIKLVIDNTNNYTWKLSPLNTEKNIFFLKDFEGNFKFKVYVQDLLFNVGERVSFNILINAYFVEPKHNDFYQLTVAAETLSYPNDNVKIGKISDSDQITQTLIKMIDYLMSNIKYKENVITSVPIPDEIKNKKFSEKEIKRITKNIDILKKQNIPYNENMKLIPSETNTKLSDKTIIYKNMMRKFILATFATTFMYEVDEMDFAFIYNQFDSQYGLNTILNDDDKKILEDIKNESFNIDKTKLSWLYEECAMYLWVLNLGEFPSQQQQCNVDSMNELLFMKNDSSLSELYIKFYNKDDKKLNLESLHIKSYDEILEKADLLNRYRWASDEVRTNNKPIGLPFDSMIVYHQCNALFNILNWNDGNFA